MPRIYWIRVGLFVFAGIFVLLLLFVSCEMLTMNRGMPGPDMAPPVNGRVGKDYVVIETLFATDRNQTGSDEPSKIFGVKRSEVSYGVCEVTIPHDRNIGELNSPSFWQFENPSKHIILADIELKDKLELFDELRARLENTAERSALVFVHGYQNSFEDAARRSAQLAYDLNFKGVPMFYSWPSQGTYRGYRTDGTNIAQSTRNIQVFLEDLVSDSAIDHIYLIAHSMGNRAVANIVTKLNDQQSGKIRELILTAPDIDALIFENEIAPAIDKTGISTTLYASDADLALWGSELGNGYPRIGAKAVVLPGIETIDATEINDELDGHLYYGNNRVVLSDISYAIRGLKASERTQLREIKTDDGPYWKILP